MRRVIGACAIVAVSGSAASAQSISWVSPVDGNWNNSGGWSMGNIPNTAGEDAVLGLVGAYTVSTTNSWTVGSISITNPFAILSIGDVQHTISGDLFNDGTVVVNTNATIFNGSLVFGADATISGAGTIVLNGPGAPDDASVSAGGSSVVTHSAGHTIRGAGRLQGVMHNNGMVVADDPAGAGLRLDGTLDQRGGGRAGAENGGRLLLGANGLTIGGELFTSAGGQIIASANNHTLESVELTGELVIPGDSRTLIATGGLSNNGSVSLNPEVGIFNATLRFDTDATIGGDGTLTLRSAGDYADAQLQASDGVTLTIGDGQLVQGSGLVNASGDGVMINRGAINANDPAQALGLAGAHVGDGGVYRADGGELNLRPDATISGAVFDSSGAGRAELDIGGAATVADSTNLGTMIVRGNSGTLNIEGSIINNGVIELNPDFMIFNANVRTGTGATIGGSGSVVMTSAGSSADARLYARDASTLTIGAAQTVMGGGLIESDPGTGGTVVNLGTINANQAAAGKAPARPLELGGNHEGMGVGVYRADDGILQLGNGLIIARANFDSSGVGVVAMTTGGVATIDGATNAGELAVFGQGGTISLTDDLINDGTLTINYDHAIFNASVGFAREDVMIDGAGTVRMVTADNINDAQLYAIDGVTGTIGPDQTVAGSGIIEGRGALGVITNRGLILADDPARALELRGQQNGIIVIGPGDYRAADHCVLSFGNGMFLNGGVLDTEGDGEIAATAGVSTLAYGENRGLLGVRGEGVTLGLQGPLINDGTVHINSNGAIFNATLLFTTSLEVTGEGDIVMTTNSNEDDAQLEAPEGIVGALGPGQALMGDGQINGEFNIAGTIDPGGPSRRLAVDDIHMDPAATMRFDLGGQNEPDFDRISVRGGRTLDLNGATAVISIDPGYVPVFGDTWDIITGDTSGIFNEVVTDQAPLGQTYRAIYTADRVFVILTCDADLSGDGGIDFFDVSAFLSYFSGQDVRGDLNNDGQFNFFDVSLFLQVFGQGCDG